MLYMFPLFVVVGGPFFPLAILFYWLANNSWTFGQLWVAHRMQDKRALAKAQIVEEVKDAAKFSTPKPGAKPKTTASGRPVVAPSKIADTNGSDATNGTSNGSSAAAGKARPNLTKSSPAGGTKPAGAKPAGTKPAPGVRPQPNKTKKKNTQR